MPAAEGLNLVSKAKTLISHADMGDARVSSRVFRIIVGVDVRGAFSGLADVAGDDSLLAVRFDADQLREVRRHAFGHWVKSLMTQAPEHGGIDVQDQAVLQALLTIQKAAKGLRAEQLKRLLLGRHIDDAFPRFADVKRLLNLPDSWQEDDYERLINQLTNRQVEFLCGRLSSLVQGMYNLTHVAKDAGEFETIFGNLKTDNDAFIEDVSDKLTPDPESDVPLTAYDITVKDGGSVRVIHHQYPQSRNNHITAQGDYKVVAIVLAQAHKRYLIASGRAAMQGNRLVLSGGADIKIRFKDIGITLNGPGGGKLPEHLKQQATLEIEKVFHKVFGDIYERTIASQGPQFRREPRAGADGAAAGLFDPVRVRGNPVGGDEGHVQPPVDAVHPVPVDAAAVNNGGGAPVGGLFDAVGGNGNPYADEDAAAAPAPDVAVHDDDSDDDNGAHQQAAAALGTRL